MVSSQEANQKFAAAARNSAAHPTAIAEKEGPMSVKAPRPARTIPALMRTRAQTRRWRYSHGLMMRRMPDRGGDAHHPRRPLGAVLSLGAFIEMSSATRCPAVVAGYPGPVSHVTLVAEN